MKIKLTYPTNGMEAGLIYDLPDDEAREYISQGVAVAIDEIIAVYSPFSVIDEQPKVNELKKRKK